MEREDFYAIYCQNPKKVLLAIRNVPDQSGINTMNRTCPRINLGVNFSIEVLGGKPISVTCNNRNCTYHALNRDIGVSA